MVRKIGPVNYEVKRAGHQNRVQVYHVNLLKKWREPEGWLMSLVVEDDELGLEEGPGTTSEEVGRPTMGMQLNRSQEMQLWDLRREF